MGGWLGGFIGGKQVVCNGSTRSTVDGDVATSDDVKRVGKVEEVACNDKQRVGHHQQNIAQHFSNV